LGSADLGLLVDETVYGEGGGANIPRG
jgi:hypothetical protein